MAPCIRDTSILPAMDSHRSDSRSSSAERNDGVDPDSDEDDDDDEDDEDIDYCLICKQKKRKQRKLCRKRMSASGQSMSTTNIRINCSKPVPEECKKCKINNPGVNNGRGRNSNYYRRN